MYTSDHDVSDDFVLVEDPEWDADASESDTGSEAQQLACSSVSAAADQPAAERCKGRCSAVLGAADDMQAENNQSTAIQASYAADTDASKDVAHASTTEPGLYPDQMGAAAEEAGKTGSATNPRKLACESELQRLCHSVGHYIGPELSADLEYWRARLQTETAREQGQGAFRQHFRKVLTTAQKLCQTGAGEPTGAVPGWHWVQCCACRRCRLVSGAAFCELSLSDEETVFTCSINTVDCTAPSCAEPSHFRVSA